MIHPGGPVGPEGVTMGNEAPELCPVCCRKVRVAYFPFDGPDMECWLWPVDIGEFTYPTARLELECYHRGFKRLQGEPRGVQGTDIREPSGRRPASSLRQLAETRIQALAAFYEMREREEPLSEAEEWATLRAAERSLNAFHAACTPEVVIGLLDRLEEVSID